MSARSLLPHNTAATLAAALMPVALGAALAEAFALRVVLRLGQALPDRPELGSLFGAVADAGVIAQNLATIAGTFTLVAVAVHQLAQPYTATRATGALLLAATVWVTLAASGSGSGISWSAAHLLAFAAMSAAVINTASPPLRGGRRWLALPLAAYAALAYHYGAPAAADFGLPLPLAAESYFLAEGAAVAAALTLPFAVRPRLSRRSLIAIALLPAVIMLALLVRPWTVASLSVWTFGFTLFLPAPVYPLALASLLASIVALVRRGQSERTLAIGLAFMALGGLKLDYSYFLLLALIAVSYLSTAGTAMPASAEQPALQGADNPPLPLRKAV